MSLILVVRSSDADEPPTVCFDSPRVVIGRGGSCDVRLPDPSVSHRHASIRQRGPDYIVLDEGSTNGTYVGPVRLSPHSPRLLRSGEQIRIGRIWIDVKIEQAAPTENPQQATAEIALGLVEQALAAEGTASGLRVSVTEGPDQGATLDIPDFERPYLVGRNSKAPLALKDDDASRRHVEILRKGSQVLVRELGSKNGSTLDGEPLPANEPTVWKPGAVLQVGANQLRYEDLATEALRELERAADEVMDEDDSVDPPPSALDAEDTESDEESAPSSSAAAQAPPVSPPAASFRRAPTARAGFNSTDLLVALLALSVLGLSAVGLWWLFQSP